jgi:dTDP-4-dehydrorhamnose reductase
MADPIDILVTGGAGQVGLELLAAKWPAHIRLHAPTRETLDLANPESIRRAFAERSWAAVINSGAWTQVDKAEADSAAAFAVNALAPAVLAELARDAKIPMVQVSTDYVFNGSGNTPYAEDAPVGPVSVYGASKLSGEMAVQSIQPRSVILRTAWVLSPHRTNFLKTMLRLAGDRPNLRVVDDQRGNPTSARDIAAAIQRIALKLIDDPDAPVGTYHFVNAGQTTWAGLARQILLFSAGSGGPSAEVEGIATDQYPTPARRPANSVLATTRLTRDYGIVPRPWQDAVAEIIAELHTEGPPA